MKKFVFVVLCACTGFLASCDQINGKSDILKAENDSLLTVLSQRNAELDEMMGTFNQITEGFRQINEAENRVDLQTNRLGEGSTDARTRIKQDIEFIQKQMQENREQIAKLESMLNNSRNQSAQLKKAIEGLNQELETRAQRIEALQAELAEKNIRIQELDEVVADLSADKDALIVETQEQQNTLNQQDLDLHRAWFVFGTRKELREENILTDGGFLRKDKVLAESDINKDYFTEIDVRTTKEIRLYSKSADVLTTHPTGSYSLVKDGDGNLTLHITDEKTFWSVSKYLVIQVR
ncbi:MAG: hypothetical protein J6T82_01850 [Bacteroidaceae bacterium]|nr:hypothetical protein [Bacteroidaceae bacterium]